MTLKNLIDEVYALGFEDNIDADDLFFTSANRALKFIYTDYPIEKQMRMMAHKHNLGFYKECITHTPGEVESFTLTGGAFSFKSSGEGTATLLDENGTRTIQFKSAHTITKGFISGTATISFSGPFTFTILNLASFLSFHTADTSKIPIISDETEYRLSSYLSDFLSFRRLPEDENGNPIEKSRVNGSSVFIPTSHTGEIRIFYNRTPFSLNPNKPDSTVDIPESVAHLLPLLTAAYMWLDDDADKSSYYMQLYISGMQSVKHNELHCTEAARFVDVLGWA